jgi:hypothetical protein
VGDKANDRPVLKKGAKLAEFATFKAISQKKNPYLAMWNSRIGTGERNDEKG